MDFSDRIIELGEHGESIPNNNSNMIAYQNFPVPTAERADFAYYRSYSQAQQPQTQQQMHQEAHQFQILQKQQQQQQQQQQPYQALTSDEYDPASRSNSFIAPQHPMQSDYASQLHLLPYHPHQLHQPHQNTTLMRKSLPVEIDGDRRFSQQKTRLIRTSSLPADLTLPRTSFVSKPVQIEIDGSLAEMTQNWTEEELKTKRRLVRFKWQQEEHRIKVSFDAVSMADYHAGMTIVSCIYDEKEKFVFTSVDFINFFESLSNSKYKIEEKNRIRRNLQSLKPMTITKQRNSALFTLIMAYGSPKPRNIEKNVKVFRWASFDKALLKIASKYSIDARDMIPEQQPQMQPQQLPRPALAMMHQGEFFPMQPHLMFPFYAPFGYATQPQTFAQIQQQQQQQQQPQHQVVFNEPHFQQQLMAQGQNSQAVANEPDYVPEEQLNKSISNHPLAFPF